MSWHAFDEHKNDGELRHPADGKQWNNFIDNHRDFVDEPRNVTFALSTNGMNPFDERSNKHGKWPVILTIYNLPPCFMQKRKYLLLTIIIFLDLHSLELTWILFEAINGGHENIVGNSC